MQQSLRASLGPHRSQFGWAQHERHPELPHPITVLHAEEEMPQREARPTSVDNAAVCRRRPTRNILDPNTTRYSVLQREDLNRSDPSPKNHTLQTGDRWCCTKGLVRWQHGGRGVLQASITYLWASSVQEVSVKGGSIRPKCPYHSWSSGDTSQLLHVDLLLNRCYRDTDPAMTP